MGRKRICFLCMALVLSFSCESFADARLETIFQQFYNQAKNTQFTEKMRVYGVNHDYSTLCFIAGNSVYLFRDEEIHRVSHAKMFPAASINRIRYESDSTDGFFQLWSNEKRILTIGSP